MTDKRSKAPNLVLGDASPHGSTYTYHDVCQVGDMLKPGFFLTERDRLRAGDEVKLQQIIKEDGKTRVAEIADTVVIYSERDAVHLFAKPGYPLAVPDPAAEGGPKADAPFYVTNQGSAGFAVRDIQTKKVIFTTKDQDEAEDIAAGKIPVPQQAA